MGLERTHHETATVEEDKAGAALRLGAIGDIDPGGTIFVATGDLDIMDMLDRGRRELDQFFHLCHGVAHGGHSLLRVEQIVQPGLVNPRFK